MLSKAYQERLERMQAQFLEQQRFDWEKFVTDPKNADGGLILFPPFPPACAALITAPHGAGYAPELAEFAGEPFFMAFCSLRLRDLLPTQVDYDLKRYEEDREKLLRDIRKFLARLKNRTSPANTEEIIRINNGMEKQLGAMENDAEKIRFDLTTTNHVHPFDAGTALVRARDKAAPAENPGLKEYCTAMLAAQFHPGLSLHQRQLLQEIAADYLLPAEARAKPVAHAPEYFLPAGAQVRWPANLPAEALAKLAVFREKRSALKHELAEAVAAAEAGESEARRTKHYEELAAREATAFAELETLAEEIRRLAAGLPYPDQPEPTAFPATLVDHMGAMLDHKSSLVREVQRRAKDFGAELAPERVEVAFQHNAASLTLRPATDSSAKPARNRKEILKRFEAENKEFNRKFEELAKEMDSIRTDLQRYHDSLPAGSAPDLNTLSVEVARAGVAHQNWERYRDYRDAVLTPGLSPAQRRLLFNAAVVELEKYRLSLVN